MDVIFLQYNGIGDKPTSDVEKMKKVQGVKVVNSSLPRTVVLQVEGAAQKQRLEKFLNWSIGVSKKSKVDLEPQPQTISSPGLIVGKRLRSVR